MVSSVNTQALITKILSLFRKIIQRTNNKFKIIRLIYISGLKTILKTRFSLYVAPFLFITITSFSTRFLYYRKKHLLHICKCFFLHWNSVKIIQPLGHPLLQVLLSQQTHPLLQVLQPQRALPLSQVFPLLQTLLPPQVLILQQALFL